MSLRDDSKCWNVIDILWDIKESCVTIWEGRDILIFLTKASHQKVKRTKKSFYLNMLSQSLCFFLLFNVWRNFVQGTCPGLDFFSFIIILKEAKISLQAFWSSLLDRKNLHRYKVPDCTFTSPAPDGLAFSCFQIKYSGILALSSKTDCIVQYANTVQQLLIKYYKEIEKEKEKCKQASHGRSEVKKQNKTWTGPFSSCREANHPCLELKTAISGSAAITHSAKENKRALNHRSEVQVKPKQI